MRAEVEDLLQRAGIEGRHVQRGERRLGRAGQRRALAARVVADECERAAARVGARVVGMAQRVHRAVEAGVLAVPDAEHAVVARARQVAGQLRAVDRGRRELLVQSRHEADLGVGEPAELLVEAAEGRPLVAGDERADVQAGGAVGAALVEQHAHERLDPGQEDRALLADILVLEGHLLQLHGDSASPNPLRVRLRRTRVALHPWSPLLTGIGQRTLPLSGTRKAGSGRMSARALSCSQVRSS